MKNINQFIRMWPPIPLTPPIRKDRMLSVTEGYLNAFISQPLSRWKCKYGFVPASTTSPSKVKTGHCYRRPLACIKIPHFQKVQRRGFSNILLATCTVKWWKVVVVQ